MLYRINYTNVTKACFTGLLGMIFNGKRENDFFKLASVPVIVWDIFYLTAHLALHPLRNI